MRHLWPRPMAGGATPLSGLVVAACGVVTAGGGSSELSSGLLRAGGSSPLSAHSLFIPRAQRLLKETPGLGSALSLSPGGFFSS